jgi:hypothetical protein
MTNSLPPELQRLKAAAHGLLVQSETDAPLVPFWWPRSEHDSRFVHLEHSRNLKMQCVHNFFAPLIKIESWMNEAEIAEREKLAKLRDAILENLGDPHVYRIGEEVYILGRIAAGVGGLKTEVVET